LDDLMKIVRWAISALALLTWMGVLVLTLPELQSGVVGTEAQDSRYLVALVLLPFALLFTGVALVMRSRGSTKRP